MPMNEYRLIWEALDGRSGHAVGRLLLARLYREETGENCPEIRIAAGGKPYFADAPLYFSISHTKKHAFCVLSPRPVGVDAEESDRRINLKLAEKILSEAEFARFQASADPRSDLLKLWVLKEAAAKLTGEGLRGYPNHTDFSPDDPRVQEIGSCYVAILEEEKRNAHAV